METFGSIKNPVVNPAFSAQRRRILEQLDPATIDAPIVTLVRRFNELSSCFTLQSCYGHFVYTGEPDRYNTQPLPRVGDIGSVEYRIAYLAFCIDPDVEGLSLLRDLSAVPHIDPDYIQLGCADWFWQRQLNSYALQVEPKRYQTLDQVRVGHEEALHIEAVRDAVFAALERLLDARQP